MQKIVTIIRSEILKKVEKALSKIGVKGISICPIMGFGD